MSWGPFERPVIWPRATLHPSERGNSTSGAIPTYFNPTYRGTADEGRWVADEESQGITGSTVHSVEVGEVSGGAATAEVDVSFEDDAGSPRFRITWRLVEEGGRWKLDEQLSAQNVK